ncbi:hypothetical protein [Caldithrix abyssi]
MYLVIFIFFMITFIVGCNKENGKNILNLPLSKDCEWIYVSKGYQSYDLNIGERPIFLDTISIDDSFANISNNEVSNNSYDTLFVRILNIDKISEDSIIYEYNFDFIRFWGNKILKVKDGYQRYFGKNQISPYIIKFPIEKGKKWINKFSRVIEKCTISVIDTTLKVHNKIYKNCIGLRIIQIREGNSFNIEMYFNQEYGLVYYIDEKSNDELVLIKVMNLK